jgi:HK97 family phage prohead protease
VVIHGYAAVWWNPDDPGTEGVADDGKTRLRVMPGAFTETLRVDDITGQYGHRDAREIGSVEEGTLRVWEDAIGLRYELRPVGAAGRNVVRRIDRGKLAGSSWRGYVTEARDFTAGDGRAVREIRRVRLIEVGPVTSPRFDGATCWIGPATAPGERAAGLVEADRVARELSRMRLAEQGG